MTSHILFVSDKPNSPLSIAAQSRAKTLGADLIFATDFKSPTEILLYISRFDYRKVLFCWRGALKEGLNLAKFRRLYLNLSSHVTFHCLIPDFIGVSPRFNRDEELLLESVHGYWVTCEKLLSIYLKCFPRRIPDGILHDIPNVELIKRSFSEIQKSKIIWVGNSKWGRRFGFHDHKGFQSIVNPLASKYRSKLNAIVFEVIDSSVKKVENREVLASISTSKVLIHASSSEGTGLPILEALGLGVVPVTTDVGVASEVLTGSLSKFIVECDVADFEKKISDALSFSDRTLLTASFDKYVAHAESELLSWGRREIKFSNKKKSFVSKIRVHSIWLYRFLNYKNLKTNFFLTSRA